MKKNGFRVREAGGNDRGRWNAFFETQPDRPPFAMYEWKAILERAYGVRCRWLIAEDASGQVRGALPLYRSRSGSGGDLFGLRFGLAAVDSEAESHLLRAAEDIAASEGIHDVMVCSGYRPVTAPLQGWRPDPRTTMVADIRAGEEAAWAGLRPNVRNNIRKGSKAGVVVEWDLMHLPDFHRIYLDLMARKGLPGHSLAFFEGVFAHLGDRAGLLAAVAGGRVVGGTIVLRTGAVHHSTFQAADPDASGAYAPTPAMEWELIRSAIAAGASEADLGESTPGSGTYQFKRRYGGEPTEIHYYRYTAAPAGPKPPRPGTSASTPPARPSIRRHLYDAAPLWGKRWISQRRMRRGRII